MVATDYAGEALDGITATAAAAGLTGITTARHDARDPLPFPDGSFDASYSHMLFCMALSTSELEALVTELRRVLRPGGVVVYTARHTGDAHYGAGVPHGDGLFENGGFVVRFFDDALVQRLARGFEITDVTAFEEGELPRRLWSVTMEKAEP